MGMIASLLTLGSKMNNREVHRIMWLLCVYLSLVSLSNGQTGKTATPGSVSEGHFLDTKPLEGEAGDFNNISEEARALIENEWYDAAEIRLLQELRHAQNPSLLHLELSKVLTKNGDHRSAYKHFAEALSSVSLKNGVSEVNVPELKGFLNICDFLRTNKYFRIGQLVLDANRDKFKQPSALFLRAYHYGANDNIPGFFEDFYEAYQADSKSKWALPGLAIIEFYSDSNELLAKGGTPLFIQAASAFWDNDKLWQTSVGWINQQGLLGQEQEIKKFIQGLQPFKSLIFWFYYHEALHQDDQARAMLKQLESYSQDNPRLDFFRRRLWLALNNPEMAIKGIGLPPEETLLKLKYYQVWLEYWDRKSWDESQFIDSFSGFLEALTGFVSPYVPEDQVTEIQNIFLGRWVATLADATCHKQACVLLETNRPRLDDNRMKLLSFMYLAVGDINSALPILLDLATDVEGDEAESLLKTCLDYSCLTENTEITQKSLELAEKRGYLSLCHRYQAIASVGMNPGDHGMILDIPSHYGIELVGPTKNAVFRECAVGSLFSVLRFWGQSADYQVLLKGLNARMEKQPPFEMDEQALIEYAEQYDLKISCWAPSPQVIRELIRCKVPSILCNYIFSRGQSVGHMSIVYGYDDRSETIFLIDDSSTEGQTRMTYQDLSHALLLIVMVPKSTRLEMRQDDLSQYRIDDSLLPLSRTQIKSLAQGDPLIHCWAYAYNMSVCTQKNDLTTLVWFDDYLKQQCSPSIVEYEKAASVSSHRGQMIRLKSYIEKGLHLQPDSVILLGNKVYLGSMRIPKENPLKDATITDLLELTKHMEAIDSDYPDTYFYRGFLLRLNDAPTGEIAAAFRKFINKVAPMHPLLKKNYQSEIENAARWLQQCRGQLEEELR